MLGAFLGLILIAIALSVGTLTALGAGHLLALAVPQLSLFQSTMIILAVMINGVVLIGLFAANERLDHQTFMLNEIAGWDTDEDDKEQASEKQRAIAAANRAEKRANLNALCSCGSGRKFKNCCLKKQPSAEGETAHI
jgi:hypothetical protein